MEALRIILIIAVIGIPVFCTYLWYTQRGQLAKGIGAGLIADLVGTTIYGMISNITHVFKNGNYVVAIILMIICLAVGLGIVVAITKIYDKDKNKSIKSSNKKM